MAFETWETLYYFCIVMRSLAAIGQSAFSSAFKTPMSALPLPSPHLPARFRLR